MWQDRQRHQPVTYFFRVLHGTLWKPIGQLLTAKQTVPTPIYELGTGIGHHLPDGQVIQIHVEVRGDLPTVLNVKEGEGDVKRLHLENK